MQPGPEMDRLIAEKVMGYTCAIGHPKSMFPGKCLIRNRPDMTHEFDRWSVFEPSANIAHAWEVVERMSSTGKRIRLFQGEQEPWWCSFGLMPNNESGDTAPIAICRAALRAIGET